MKYLQLFYDGLDSFDDLSDEEAGQLIKAIIQYNKGYEHELKGALKALFTMFKNEIDRTKDTYENKCKVNKANGSLGGRPKTQNNRTVKKITQKTQDKDKDKDKDNIYIDFNYYHSKFDFIDKDSFLKLVEHLKEKHYPLTKVRVTNNIKKLKNNPTQFKVSVDEMIRLDYSGLFISKKATGNTTHFSTSGNEIKGNFQ